MTSTTQPVPDFAEGIPSLSLPPAGPAGGHPPAANDGGGVAAVRCLDVLAESMETHSAFGA